MTDETGAPAGGEAIAADLPADAPESFASASEAAAYFTSLTEKRKNPPAESAETATADNESASKEADAAPDADQAHGEDEDIDPASKEPPIERPKSWTESEEAEWRATPRALQQKIAARELERDTALRRTQNDAAEKLKGLTAKEQAAEQAKQQYEAQLPALMQTLQDAQQSSFSDIRTVDDVTKLANEDPFRYLQWQAHQTKLQAVNAELVRVNGEQATKQQTDWTDHVQKENALAAELIPELADKVKGPALTQRAAERLGELGFKPEELNDLASGKTKLSIYDHRLQQLIFSDLKLSDIQRAKTAAAKPDLPPVTRPGTSRPSGQGVNSERIQALNRKPELTVKEATELYTLQQSSQRRAS